MQHVFINDSNNLGNHITPSNTLPEDNTFRLITFTYYGSGAGANNARITIANNSYLRTTAPTFGNGVSRYLRITGGATDNFRLKATGAYSLTGKTIAEVNNFYNVFISTLKQDSEYAGLTTI
jgi:hypothetical protein